MSLWSDFMAWLKPPAIKQIIVKPNPVIVKATTTNRTAFLAAIAHSEGTDRIPNSDNGYRALFGGGTFSSYADHPRKEFWIARLKIYTSAAGRYQIEKGTYDDCKKKLGLKDFSPSSQDAIAIFLITQCGALADVDAGRVDLAVRKCSVEWASLEGSKAGQPITPMGVFLAAYSKGGGGYEDWRKT